MTATRMPQKAALRPQVSHEVTPLDDPDHTRASGVTVDTYLRTERLGGGAIVCVEGPLDERTVAALDSEVRRQSDRHGSRLVLDLSRSTLIDAAAIALMDKLSFRADAAGGTVIIVLPCARAGWLLDLVPTREELQVVGSVAEAMTAWPGRALANGLGSR